jgi:hypothetical protein
MRRKLIKLLPVLVAALGVGAIAWTTLMDNFLGIPLDASIGAPSNGQVPVYNSTTRKYEAGAAAAASILGQIANGATSAITTVNVTAGLTGTIASNVLNIFSDFGTAAGKTAQGNDVRFNPAPSGAGKVVYDTGAAYAATAAGIATTVLHGGAVPAFSAIVAADVSSGAATSGQVLTADGAGAVTWQTPTPGADGFGVLVTNNTSPTTTTTQTEINFRGTGVTANTSSTLIANVDIPQNYAVNRNIGGPRLLVPAYSFPGAPYWPDLLAGAPSVGIAVINPNSGPYADAGTIGVYQTQSVSVTAVGISVVGYVALTNGAKSSAAVQAEIDTYYYLFPNIDGVFFDQCPTSVALQPYVQALFNYVKTQRAGQKIVILNPGTEPLTELYTRCGDIICTFEGDHTTYQTYSPVAWTKNYPPSKFYHIVHGDTADGTNIASQMEADMALAHQRNAGWVYITNQFIGTNPYDDLPTPIEYFYAEVRMSARGHTLWQTNGTNTQLGRTVNITGTGVTSTSNPTNSTIDYTIAGSGSSPVAGSNISVSGSTVSVSPTTAASGDLLASNGSFFVILAQGAASTALTVSAGNVLAYSTITNAMLAGSITGDKISTVPNTLINVSGDMTITPVGTNLNVTAGKVVRTDTLTGATTNGTITIDPNGTGLLRIDAGQSDRTLTVSVTNSTSVIVSYTALQLFDSSGRTITVKNGSFTVNTGTIGALGLTSAATTNDIYHGFVYNTASGTTCQFDTSSTGANLQSNLYKRRVGSIFTKHTSADLINTLQIGDFLHFNYNIAFSLTNDGGAVAFGLTAQTPIIVNLAPRMPSTARKAFLWLSLSSISSSSLSQTQLQLFGSATNPSVVSGIDVVTDGTGVSRDTVVMVTNPDQSIRFSVSGGGTPTVSVGVMGYWDTIGL